MSGTRTQVGIVEWAQRTASARAIELQLAAKLGGWVPRVQSSGAKLLLARHARHHAWHAELWDGLVPVLHDQAPMPGIAEPELRSAALVLAATEEPAVVYDDVLSQVVASYRSWSVESTPIAERPVMRVLDLVLRDLDFDAQEGHDLFSRH
ncbi:MAG: hypothetical protein ACHQDE_05605 [Acidimicrobiia bacterium]